jgi:hypothetical protein
LRALLFSILFIQSSFATFYIAAFDKFSESWGVAYSSSGGNFRMRSVKDKGMIGYGSYGRCVLDDESLFLEGFSANQITQSIYKACSSIGWEKFRMTAVTSDGVVSSLIAKDGCHRSNRNCMDIVKEDFVITAGGLKRDVHQKTMAYYQSIKNNTETLECKLLRTLRYMHKVGGEYLDFIGASVTVDSLDRNEVSHFWMKREKNQLNEKYLLTQIKYQMHHKGIKCD